MKNIFIFFEQYFTFFTRVFSCIFLSLGVIFDVLKHIPVITCNNGFGVR